MNRQRQTWLNVIRARSRAFKAVLCLAVVLLCGGIGLLALSLTSYRYAITLTPGKPEFFVHANVYKGVMSVSIYQDLPFVGSFRDSVPLFFYYRIDCVIDSDEHGRRHWYFGFASNPPSPPASQFVIIGNLNVLGVLFAVLGLIVLLRQMKQIRPYLDRSLMLCGKCGYDLRGHQGNSKQSRSCPECGEPFNLNDSSD